jgi:hypothetical protein
MNCHESTVRKAIREGRILESSLERNVNGRLKGINHKKAKIDWARNYSIGSNASSPVADSLQSETITEARLSSTRSEVIKEVTESKKLQEHYKAELARIEFEEKEKHLVSRDEVRKDLYKFGLELRIAIQGVPDLVADDVSLEENRNKCHKIILEGMNEALRKVTEVVERDFG